MFLKRARYEKQGSHSGIISAIEKCIHIKPAVRYGFRGSVITDVGCVRSKNEDNFLFAGKTNAAGLDYLELSTLKNDAAAQWMTAGVFDGISQGGHAEAASLEAVKAFQDAILKFTVKDSKEKVDSIIYDAFSQANRRIIEQKRIIPVIGTTGTVLCTNLKEFKIYHLGDSRAYLFRRGKLYQLTRDQTMAQLKLDAGIYDESYPQNETDCHMLTDYIGRYAANAPLCPTESKWIPILENDYVMLCSDGLSDMCSQSEMVQIFRTQDTAGEQTKKLVDIVRRKEGRDNITCMVFQFSKQIREG